jgi:hypothetical protein
LALRLAFGRFLPHATFRVLAGVGHLSPLERPGELAAACLDFLASLARDGESALRSIVAASGSLARFSQRASGPLAAMIERKMV